MKEALLQKLLTQYRVPVHIRKHMQKVAAVALYLGQRINQHLKTSEAPVNMIVVRQGALLHDVLKICDFKTLDFENFEQNVTAEDIQFWTALMKSCQHIGHEEAGYNMLKEAGEEQIATIVRKHRFSGLIEPENRPTTWEEKLVYYADKRVLHHQIVSVAQRLQDGRARYFPDGHTRAKRVCPTTKTGAATAATNFPPNDHLVEKALYQLEKALCLAAGVKPEDITEQAVEAFLEHTRTQ